MVRENFSSFSVEIKLQLKQIIEIITVEVGKINARMHLYALERNSLYLMDDEWKLLYFVQKNEIEMVLEKAEISVSTITNNHISMQGGEGRKEEVR